MTISSDSFAAGAARMGVQAALLVGCSLFGFNATAALLVPQITPPGGLVHSPAFVTVTNPNPRGAIFYTVDGNDPRDHFGNVVTNARSYANPISVNRSLIVRARAKSGTNWSEIIAAPFTADQDFSKLLFTEVMFHPRNADDDRVEFVELKNTGPVALNLSGLEFGSAIKDNRYLPAGTNRMPDHATVGPGQFFILANDTNSFAAAYGGISADADFY